MKVLQINSVCGIKSTGRIATDLYHVLKEHGHECKIAYGRDEARNIPLEDTIKIGTELDVRIHGVRSRITDKAGFYSKKYTLKLIDFIKEYDPDVIHLHNLHGYYLHLPTLFHYLKLAGKKVVWTLHDCWSFTGHCSHFDFIGCEKWKTGCHNCNQINEYPKSLFWDNSENNYNYKKVLFTSIPDMTLICPSEWLTNLVKDSYFSTYPVKCINNGIDLTVFTPTVSSFRKKYNIEDKFVILGVASVWEPRKGLSDFIKLSQSLTEDERIVLVGLSDKQKEQLPSNIIGITHTSNVTELAEIYTTSDVFVNTTYEETLGLVNIEALACGTPVVTYRTGGSPECVDDTCGIIVPKGDISALLNAARQTAKTHIDKNTCIEFAKRFDKNDIYLKYLKVYSEMR